MNVCRPRAPVFVFLFLLMVAVADVQAQAPRVLTLDDVVALARTQAAAVERAHLDVAISEASVTQAQAGRWPSFNLYSAGSQRYGLSFDQTAGQLTQETSEYAESGITASWTVFDGFARQASIASARAGRDAARFQHVRTEQAAVTDALRLFYEVASAGATLDVVRSNVDTQERQFAMVDAQIEAGLRPASEIYLQQERLADAELQVLDAERVLHAAELRLLRHLALDPTETYRFAYPDDPVVESVDLSVDLVDVALERRPDVRALDAALASAAAERRLSRATRWPTVSVSGSVATAYTSTRPTDFSTQLAENRRGTIGLNVGLPLFDGGDRTARARIAEARLLQMEIEAADRRREVTIEVLEVIRELEVRVREVSVADRRAVAARASAEAERDRYQHGVSTLAALAEANTRLVEAEVRRAQARHSLAVTRVLLDYRTGMLDR